MMQKEPTDSLYHLSHGQREPVSYWSALSQRRTAFKKQTADQFAHAQLI
jgi:hypothetical protein